MVRSNSYFTLMASLPALPAHFEVERVPITQPRLAYRLRMLEPDDYGVVRELSNFLVWDRQRRDRTDEEMIAEYRRLTATLTNPMALHIVNFRMDVRTIMSGLRRRRRGMAPPAGLGRWVEVIRRNWNQHLFGLGNIHPWIAEVEPLLKTTDCLAAERILLGVSWREWRRLGGEHHFSFEAVLLYLARWEIVNRWTGLDAETGRNRFGELVTESLGEYANLYE